MVVTPEVRVARVEQDGRQLRCRCSAAHGRGVRHRPRARRRARARGLDRRRGGVNEPGTHQPLTSREDLVGAIARKAREFVLLLSLPRPSASPWYSSRGARRRACWATILHEPYPELGDLDVYPETGDALA
jgi:hypothetical protein